MGQGLGDWDGDVGRRDVALGDVGLGHSGDAGTVSEVRLKFPKLATNLDISLHSCH